MNAIQQGSLSGIGNYLLSLKPVIQKNADRIASHAGSREPKVTQQQLTSAPWLLPDSKETEIQALIADPTTKSNLNMKGIKFEDAPNFQQR